MRTLILILLFGIFSSICFSQSNKEITEKRNIFNKKGDYYSDRKEYKKAISYYNLAYKNDASDFFSVIKKAEAYTKLKWHPQAEQCYRIIFESNLHVANDYKLKYALSLLANDKIEEFQHWLALYSEVVNEEIQSENYLISSEKRIQLYKDTCIVLVSETNKIDSLHFKLKYAAYKYNRKSSGEDEKIFVVFGNGTEYSISASESEDFEFSFQPMEKYKLIIQQENIKAEDILEDGSLTPEQRKKAFMSPTPINKDELILEKGMKYQFSSGKYKISPQYINTLKKLSDDYQSSGSGAVDLTALVKELQLAGGEVYTIRFIKLDDPDKNYKKLEISTLTMNDKTVNIYGKSFIVLLPDRLKENFAIQTDIEVLEKNFNPRKHSLLVDDSPMFKTPTLIDQDWLISLSINTESLENVRPSNRLSAEEISIIPGTEYLLSLSKPDPRTGRSLEIIVPLTRGVKYNLTSAGKSDTEYKEALAEFLLGRNEIAVADEEVIDISLLSKELEVKPGEDLSFSLHTPVKKYGKPLDFSDEVKTILTADERVIELTHNDKYTINVPFSINGKITIQTDLEHMQENFADEAYTLRLDTISFTSEITVDTSGYGELKSSGWLSMSVNTESIEEVDKQNQFMAREVSIIPGKEYILTVSKIDAKTGKKEEIIIPLIRDVRYDFTSNPGSETAYLESLDEFITGREDIKASDGTLIDITMLSKELQIAEGDEVSFSLLPVRKLPKINTEEPSGKSSLFLDNKVVEFTYIHKYTISMPLNEGQVNMQTNIQYLAENFDPGSININLDTLSFFSEIRIDTVGIGDRVIEEIKDPVFDVVTVNFDVNEHALHTTSQTTIRKSVIDELKEDDRLYVTIKGYTDALGDADYNLNLSKRRAESVKTFLRDNGIGESRIRTFSFGESKSLKNGIDWEDLSEEELKKHRKVEIVIYLPE